MDLLEHIKTKHREIYDLHKENPEATVGFRIEFLNLNVLKEDDDPKTQPIIIGEMCEATTEVMTKQNFLMPVVKKVKSDKLDLTRKKSWVWKYFIKLSSIIYRCNLCDVVLSIKGCNTNNLNRHVRSKHPIVYQSEVDGKKQVDLDVTAELDPHNIKEEIVISETELDISQVTGTPIKNSLQKRSWIWLYFDRVSSKLAQCKLCKRNICHGGNATGNMNRHLKMKHNKTGHDHSWVWKVFDNTEDDVYSCKICQYRCMRFNDIDKSVSCILHHLKLAHGVISSEQIITSIECGDDED